MRALLMITIVALGATPALAQTPPSAKPIAELQACRTKTDATERLACYDRAVAALEVATTSQQVVIVDRQEVRRARKGLFGFALPRIGFLTGKDGNKEDEADAQALATTVVAARALPYGKWRITVEGGAVWETVEADSRFTDPRPGAPITLERGSLGGFYAKVGKGRRVAAKRIG